MRVIDGRTRRPVLAGTVALGPESLSGGSTAPDISQSWPQIGQNAFGHRTVEGRLGRPEREWAVEQAGFEVNLEYVGGCWVLVPNKVADKEWLHSGWETLVMNNWDSAFGEDDESLKSHVTGNQMPNMWFWDTGEAMDLMAQESSKYSADIYHKILNNDKVSASETREHGPTTWPNPLKNDVYEDMSNCYSQLGALCRGFIKNV